MKEAYNFFERDLKINKKDTIVAAISGGPDSMCLLDILIDLKNKYNFKLIVAHVNHNMRNEAIDEANYVKEYTLKNDAIFEYFEIPKKEKGVLKEIESRKYRYDFFDELMKKYNANYLATAHHGDDLIETILMRIVRGSSLRGYSGFSMVSNKNGYKIIRPLIYYTKKELENYLDDKKIKYAYDSTNSSMDYTRNRYRHKILPFLKEEDINVHLKFKKFSESLKLYYDYVNKIVLKEKNNIYKDNLLNLNKFNKLDYLIKREILYSILSDVINNDESINEELLNNILKIIDSKKPNMKMNISKGHSMVKEYDKIIFDRIDNNYEYNIKLEKNNKLPNGKVIEIVDDIDNNSNYMTRLNTKELEMPLYIRNRRISDKMLVKGINKNKKIKDIFTNEKIPMNIRDMTPIVVDSKNTIVWIPGIKKSSFDKSAYEEYDIILRYF